MFRLQLFIDETVMDFVSFFQKKSLKEEEVEKARFAFRIFLSAWQLAQDKTLDEIITISYLSAAKKICCVKIPAGRTYQSRFV